jgi:hypothetical protein
MKSRLRCRSSPSPRCSRARPPEPGGSLGDSLILVKEDLGATAVAVIGALIFLRGARRLGSVTVVIGIGASLLEVLLVLPLMSSSGAYAYWSRLGSGPSLLQSAVAHADVKLSTVILTSRSLASPPWRHHSCS